MSKSRQSLEVVALKTIWPAILYAVIWLHFNETEKHLPVARHFSYMLLALVAFAMHFRIKIATRRPNARILKFFPIFDCTALALIIRFTGGIDSDLWLFYYFLLIAGAMDPRQRTIEISAPMVIVSYLAATLPPLESWNWEVLEVVMTRLFFLVLASLLARQIALARLRLSDELGSLSEQLTLSQERNRIAREIHDGVGHSLVNCILTLELCERLVTKDPAEAGKIIRQEKADLRSALDELRDYVHHLRPAELENEPFNALIRKYVVRFAERTGLATELTAKSEEMDLSPASRLVLLRILQESLTNAAKHSEATAIDINMSRTANSGIHCVICDNGRGFDADELLRDPSSRQGFGLRTMRDRASSVGGDVQVESNPGEGTRVSVYIPG